MATYLGIIGQYVFKAGFSKGSIRLHYMFYVNVPNWYSHKQLTVKVMNHIIWKRKKLILINVANKLNYLLNCDVFIILLFKYFLKAHFFLLYFAMLVVQSSKGNTPLKKLPQIHLPVKSLHI